MQTRPDPENPTHAAPGAGVANVEGELAAVIGKRATRLTPENALDHVLG